MSAAMIAGAGAALADTGSASESGAPSSSESSEPANHDAAKADLKHSDKPAKPKKKRKQKESTAESGASQTGKGKATDPDAAASADDNPASDPTAPGSGAPTDDVSAPAADKAAGTDTPDKTDKTDKTDTPDKTDKTDKTDKAAPTPSEADVSTVSRVPVGAATAHRTTKESRSKAAAVGTVSDPKVGIDGTSAPSEDTATEAPAARSSLRAAVEATTAVESASAAEVTATATAPRPSIIGLLTSVFFSLLSGLERLVTGPPVVPGGSTVTMRNSSLQITDKLSVPANWYYPEGEDPPDRLILLQHGFLAIGPMYSYTAARLAESTNSICRHPDVDVESVCRRRTLARRGRDAPGRRGPVRR
jgi:hypothetical protein